MQATRPGLRVRTRAGFVGIPDRQQRQLPQTPQRQLLAAITSTFHSSGIALRLTPLFVNVEGKGACIRAFLHIDGGALTFEDNGEGLRKAVVEVAMTAFDESGAAAAPSAHGFEIRLRTGQVEESARRGFDFELMHAAPKSGAYHVRAAVRDAVSGKVGSAGQFIEVPDVSRDHPGLSGIEMRAVKPGEAEPADPARGTAVRRFDPGDAITYSFTVYNPRTAPSASTEITSVRLKLEQNQLVAGIA